MNANKQNPAPGDSPSNPKPNFPEFSTRLNPEEIQAFFAGVQKAAWDAMKKAYMSTPEDGAYLKVSPRWLEELRVIGGGPLFCKLGKRVVYRMEHLDAWASEHERRNTAEGGGSHE